MIDITSGSGRVERHFLEAMRGRFDKQGEVVAFQQLGGVILSRGALQSLHIRLQADDADVQDAALTLILEAAVALGISVLRKQLHEPSDASICSLGFVCLAIDRIAAERIAAERIGTGVNRFEYAMGLVRVALLVAELYA